MLGYSVMRVCASNRNKSKRFVVLTLIVKTIYLAQTMFAYLMDHLKTIKLLQMLLLAKVDLLGYFKKVQDQYVYQPLR